MNFDSQLESAKAGFWPRPRRIIDSSLKIDDQKTQYEKWLKSVLVAKIDSKGIKVKNGIIKRDDFFNLYGIIEV